MADNLVRNSIESHTASTTSGESNQGGKRCKIVLVGDGNVGKTALANKFRDSSIDVVNIEYKPTVFDNMDFDIVIDEKVRSIYRNSSISS